MNKTLVFLIILVVAIVTTLFFLAGNPDSDKESSDESKSDKQSDEFDVKAPVKTNPYETKTVKGVRTRADKSSEKQEYYLEEYSDDKPKRIKPIIVKSNLPFVVWKMKFGGSIIQKPVITNGNIYVASSDYQVHCLKTRNGSIVFSSPIPSQPIGANNYIYKNSLIVAQRTGAVHAINLKTGEKTWRHRSAVDKKGLDISITGISIHQDSFFVSKHWGNVYIGSLKDSATTETPGVTYESRIQIPTVFYKNTMIFTNVAGELHAFEMKGTKKEWRYIFEKGYLLSLVEDNGYLYGLNNLKELICFDIETKSIKWKTPLSALGYQSLVVDADAVYVGAGDLYAINKQDGKVIWQKEKVSKEGFKRPMTLTDNTLYCTETNGLVYSIKSKDGSIIKQWDIKEPIWSGITYDKGLIFVPTIKKHLITIKTY